MKGGIIDVSRIDCGWILRLWANVFAQYIRNLESARRRLRETWRIGYWLESDRLSYIEIFATGFGEAGCNLPRCCQFQVGGYRHKRLMILGMMRLPQHSLL